MPDARPSGLLTPNGVFAAIAILWIASFVHFHRPDGVLGRVPFAVFAFNTVVSLLGLGAAYVVSSHGAVEKRRRKIKVLAAALAVLLAIAACELPVAMGWLDYRAVFHTVGGADLHNPRYRVDRELIGIRYPHDLFRGSVAGDLVHRLHIDTHRRYDVDVRWDRNGFRNSEEMERADVVLIGDSYLEAALVPWSETLTARLSQSLGRPVLNLGQGGYGPQQELVVLRRFGFPAQPKLVIWFFYEGNDLGNCLTYEAVQRDWEKWESQQHGFPARSFAINAGSAVSRLICSQPRNSSLAEQRKGILEIPGEHRGQAMYFGYQCAPRSVSEERAVTITRQVLTDAAKECRERGIRFVVAFVPTKWRVYHSLVRIEPNSELAEWTLTDLNQRLVSPSLDEPIQWIDLTTPLTESAGKGSLVYFLDDAHWTAAGHEVVADAVRPVVEQDGSRVEEPRTE